MRASTEARVARVMGWFAEGVPAIEIAQREQVKYRDVRRMLAVRGFYVRPRKSGHRRDEEKWIEAALLYRDGYDYTAIARRIGMERSSVRYAIRIIARSLVIEPVTKRRPAGWREGLHADICRDYAQGMSTRQVAARRRTSHSTVLWVLEQQGIARRSTGYRNPAGSAVVRTQLRGFAPVASSPEDARVQKMEELAYRISKRRLRLG